jgi:signal transduction histidine kinase
MMGNSIRIRLWSAATISILIALAIAGIGLRFLFERHVERRVVSELTVDLNELISATSFPGAGKLSVTPVFTDPRFKTPLSGYYWQVEDIASGELTRSRSLWDATIAKPADQSGDGSVHVEEMAGPDGTIAIAVTRKITEPNGRSFRATVMEDHRTIQTSVSEYVRELAPAIVLLACVLTAAFFTQITVGLTPLAKLRSAVSDVIGRRTARLDGSAPSEVQPLADEINRLLEMQERALARARSRATDLAHGLKTPLQVLAADIRLLRQKGEADLANEIEKSLATIRRHIDVELARARLAPDITGKTECGVLDIAESIVGVVERTPRGRRLQFAVDVAEALAAPVDEGDLSEILGNLIENAARFAKISVRVEGSFSEGGVVIVVADDGPGIPDADRKLALSRGVQLDRKSGGNGLGLAIVSDIVDAYGGRLNLTDGKPGLTVTIFLPRHS